MSTIVYSTRIRSSVWVMDFSICKPFRIQGLLRIPKHLPIASLITLLNFPAHFRFGIVRFVNRPRCRHVFTRTHDVNKQVFSMFLLCELLSLHVNGCDYIFLYYSFLFLLIGPLRVGWERRGFNTSPVRHQTIFPRRLLQKVKAKIHTVSHRLEFNSVSAGYKVNFTSRRAIEERGIKKYFKIRFSIARG